jgi:histidinol-phosphatase (PHP family)
MHRLQNNYSSARGTWFPARDVNLHTHCYYCRHGSGEIADYIRMAKERGLKVLGMSDHAPVPDGRWPLSRMTMSELPSYFADVIHGQQDPELIVLRSMECDYLPEYHSYYQQELLGTWACDYLVGSVHTVDMPYAKDVSLHQSPLSKAELAQYARQYIDMLSSGLFLFGAHPDVFGCSYLNWNKEAEVCSRAILEAAADLRIPLEINGNGFRRAKVQGEKGLKTPYPMGEFWNLAAEYGVTVMTNSDAHVPKDVDASFQDSSAFAVDCGLSFAGLRLSERNAAGKVVLWYEASSGLPFDGLESANYRVKEFSTLACPAFV